MLTTKINTGMATAKGQQLALVCRSLLIKAKPLFNTKYEDRQVCLSYTNSEEMKYLDYTVGHKLKYSRWREVKGNTRKSCISLSTTVKVCYNTTKKTSIQYENLAANMQCAFWGSRSWGAGPTWSGPGAVHHGLHCREAVTVRGHPQCYWMYYVSFL